MSPGLLKMLFTFVGVILMFIATISILLSRHRLKGWLAKIVSFIAYISFISGGIIILFIVFSGPTK